MKKIPKKNYVGLRLPDDLAEHVRQQSGPHERNVSLYIRKVLRADMEKRRQDESAKNDTHP